MIGLSRFHFHDSALTPEVKADRQGVAAREEAQETVVSGDIEN